MKFRKKPVVIEAIQWTGENISEIQEFVKLSDRDIYYNDYHSIFTIRTLEGEMSASKGDWIIKGVKGEFYPCKPEIFKESYDEVIE